MTHTSESTYLAADAGNPLVARTLAQAILTGVEELPHTRFVVDSEVRPRSATAQELVEDARRLAAGMQARGVAAGDVVALQMPNWYEAAVIQAAAAFCGATVLPIVQMYGRREVEFILRDSGASVLFLAGSWRDRYYPAMLAEFGDLPALKTVVVLDHDPAPNGTIPFEGLMGVSAESWTMPEVDVASVALLMYTSGTTGNPKGVQHSHTSLLGEVASMPDNGEVGPENVNLAVFPGGHMAGMLELLRVMVYGTHSVTMDRWDPERAARLVDEYGVTASAGVPIHIGGLLDARDQGVATLASLKYFLLGGASVPPASIRRAHDAGIVAYRSYGMTEHPTITMGQHTDTLEERSNTDGRLTAGTEVRVLDASWDDVPVGQDGEFAVRGPERFIGYRDEKLNAASFLEGGWFLTGDIGHVDERGFLTVTDRKKDIIVRAGENMSSKEIEDVLANHPRVREVAVIGAPDDRYGERVCAVVVLDGDEELTLQEVAELFSAAGVAKQKTPEQIISLPSLPRTAIGKLHKGILRTRLFSGQD